MFSKTVCKRRVIQKLESDVVDNKEIQQHSYVPPTSSTPSSNMSFVKSVICPVKEDRLPLTWPRDWPRPEPSPPSHDDILRRAANQTKTKQGRRGARSGVA